MSGTVPVEETTSVLVVGGGLTGLSAAVFLRRHGVPVTLVERHRGVLVHPRARTVNPRTQELFRQAGLADDVRARRNTGTGDLMIRAETLAGPERSRMGESPGEDPTAFSPCSWVPVDQDRLEELLRERAADLGARLRFGTLVESFEQDADGVRATVRDLDDGAERVLTADYMIAADGADSPVRRRLGIAKPGPGVLGETVTLAFEADLSRHVRGRSIAVCHVDRPVPGTVIVPHDGADRWVFSVPLARVDEAEAADMIRKAVGDPELEPRLVPQLRDGTRLLRYTISAGVAERFRDGRVFLAGDAAHTMPPVGALGSGTGIQDAHNLAWKLAAVLDGQAGAGLLDTYEAERRPVAEFTMRQALLLMRDRTGRNVLGTDEPAAPYYGVVFGYRYPDGAGAVDPEAFPPEELTGQVGTRAPHLWIGHGGETVSTLDLYRDRPVLLAGPAGEAWCAGARIAADRLGVRLDVHAFGADLHDPGGVWDRGHRMPANGALLVRPDGFVAWRSPDHPVDAADAVSAAVANLLHIGL
ncbi:FAD-dependent oxidoreductase [Actinomadura rubrobrunea]|uniref:FAD-dependent oxidoreductase n=1 Tax=Actinomadura rubrobrunea TaxID=115335 RepID=A0A9W6PT10_9ACTN|nr:FAD-dependent oxidoreductase [Actinomadura rubrobrunea]GLW63940.1 FAD-dependent oxidoreductase [Actinomadura rubrobrunea]